MVDFSNLQVRRQHAARVASKAHISLRDKQLTVTPAAAGGIELGLRGPVEKHTDPVKHP